MKFPPFRFALPATLLLASLSGCAEDDAGVCGAVNAVPRASYPAGPFGNAAGDTLADPARSAALADYLTRLVKSFNYLAANRDRLAQSVFVKQYGLTPEQATALANATGPAKFIELPGDVLEPQQRLAKLFTEAGQIPTEVDVRREFDTRFNDLVKGAQGS